MSDAQVKNELGALALALADGIEEAVAVPSDRGVSTSAALATLHFHPGESVDTLARVLGLSHSGAVRLVDRLERAGLVLRARIGREVAVTLTDAGHQRARQLLARRHTVLDAAVSALDTSEQQRLKALLDKMLTATIDHQRARHTCRLCDEASCVPRGCPINFHERRD